MYMRVQYNFERNKTWRDFVDVSSYTGMEVEHGHNTANLHPMNAASNLGHFDPTSGLQSKYGELQSKIQQNLGGLKKTATNH